MISVSHANPTEALDDHVFRLSARARRVRVDWESLERALAAANDEFGWEADFCINPERRHVSIVVPAANIDHVARTTLDFYGAVADRIGMKEFLSIWVDFDVPR
ncbi:MAG: hypothetical protein ACJ8J0_17605 [Longimicrobiaceae bacterium]